MYILKGYIDINFFLVFMHKSLTYKMRVYYFLCSMTFCVEKRIRVCQALIFMEQKSPFKSMSGFYYTSLAPYSFSVWEKTEVVPYYSRLIFVVS